MIVEPEAPLEEYWQKYEARIKKLWTKKYELQNKMKELRWDSSKEDQAKEMELKNLSDEINDTEVKLVEQIKTSISAFATLLELPSNVKSIYDDRKKEKIVASPPLSPRPSQNEVAPQGVSAELPYFRTTSSSVKLSNLTTTTGSANKRRGGLNLLIDKFFEDDAQPERSELDVLEQEIVELRAALVRATGEKNQSKTHQRKIEDIREQLKLKVSQREKLLHRQHTGVDTTLDN